MPTYKYEVRDAGGGVAAGVLEATSAGEATSLLRSQGSYVLNVAQAASGPVASGHINPLPSALAPMAAGRHPATAAIAPSRPSSPITT